MSLNRQTQNFAPFLKLLLINQNCPNTKSLLMQILAPDQSCWLQWISHFWKLSNQITYSGNCCPGHFFFQIVVLNNFFPNCPTGSLIAVLYLYFSFLQIVMNGIQTLDHIFCILWYQILLFNWCDGTSPLTGDPILKLRNHITLRRPWPFKMELWFCRLEFGVKYLECGNVCRGWH